VPLLHTTYLLLVDLHMDPQDVPSCVCACGILLLCCASIMHQLSSLATASTFLSLYLHCAVPSLSTQYDGHITRPLHGGPVSKVRVWVGLSLGAATFVVPCQGSLQPPHPICVSYQVRLITAPSKNNADVMNLDLQEHELTLARPAQCLVLPVQCQQCRHRCQL